MYNIFKRLCSFILATLSLLLFSPIFLLIAIIIKLDSKGPIFFKQKRIGINGEIFLIYKFRSMKIDTPNLATDKLGDPNAYVTRIGRFLRKTSLDELPQLFNILVGDMAIVGPRPALYNQYELIDARDKKKINSIRPGLTGYAQVMGRDFITDEKKVEYDEYYCKNISIILDIKIILRTFINVIKSEGVKS
ncbi:sugar transferase [Bacillus cereus]|uniref:sugar transferase n=1 Tax=Bacillus paranthracis TaxID=2026186 RepID=UPI0002B8E2E1|nr:sugar transferase [Bacillus paranthracis]RGO17497.1 sugar transferase [Bacillus cereus]